MTGKGVPRNREKAAYWYRKSAELDDPTAQFMLALCYKYGDGVPADPEQMAYWHRRSEETWKAGIHSRKP